MKRRQRSPSRSGGLIAAVARVDTGEQHHNFPGENLSKALLTIAQTMGSTRSDFGLDAGRVTAPLNGIRV